MGLNQGPHPTEASHRCKGVGVFAWKEGLKGAVRGFLNGVLVTETVSCLEALRPENLAVLSQDRANVKILSSHPQTLRSLRPTAFVFWE